MGGPGSGKKKVRPVDAAGNYDPYFVNPEEWPQETYCRNVMCRRKWMREFGESEFCVACRKHLNNCGRKDA